MSRQSSLDQYFKCKTSPALRGVKSPIFTTRMNKKNIAENKRSLSLIKPSTPGKTPKISNASSTSAINTHEEVINLCSDEENENTLPEERNTSLSQKSNDSSSNSTVIYNLTPSTPKKSPQQSTSKHSRSPKSEKFFSPTKKRAVLRTPVKRNLAMESFESYQRTPTKKVKSNSNEDEAFIEACNGMDDKSIFLLTIINNFLEEDSLKALLDERSIELLRSCFSILKPGIRLLCRLFWRKHGWFRKKQLLHIIIDKKEVISEQQLLDILDSLIENSVIKASATFGTNTMCFDELINILKGDEVKQICKDLKLKIQSKQDAKLALKNYSQQKSISNYFSQSPISGNNNSNRVLTIMRSKAGTCYRLSDLAISTLHKLYLITYLGLNYEFIRDKKLEMLLINEKINRETYPIDKGMELDNASVVFKNKEEFARYWHAHQIYEDFLTRTDAAEKCGIVSNVYKMYNDVPKEDMTRYKSLPTWLRRYTPPYLFVKILEAGIQELKKSPTYHQLALDVLTTLIGQIAFRQRKKAEWYAEKALVLHKHMERHDEAAEVLLEGLKSNMSEEDKDTMRPRANKIANQQNIQLAPGLKDALKEYGSKELILEKTFHAEHVRKQHMENTNQRGKKKFEVHTEDGKKFLDAEDFCVLDYTTNGDYTHGEHWEGRIVTTIFHLLFWDIIYTKPRGVVGVFLSHYQLHPLDLYDESFYLNRKTLVDDRLMRIEAMSTEEVVECMKTKWEERPEYELSGINRSIGWDNVRMVAACLGPRAVAAVCRRLATNYGYAHTGFPDLTLWNMLTKKIKFVEVKTDTDKPSMKQLQGMQYLRQNNIETGFCYVGVFSNRSRARATGASPIISNKTETEAKIKTGTDSDKTPSPVKKQTRTRAAKKKAATSKNETNNNENSVSPPSNKTVTSPLRDKNGTVIANDGKSPTTSIAESVTKNTRKRAVNTKRAANTKRTANTKKTPTKEVKRTIKVKSVEAINRDAEDEEAFESLIQMGR